MLGTIARLLRRGRKSGGRLLRVVRGRAFEPWNHEAALLQLCHGDRAQMERLIQLELDRRPGMSRAGAALAAATRLRHDRR